MEEKLKKSDEKVLLVAMKRSMYWRIMRGSLFLLPLFWLAAAAGDLSIAHQLGGHAGYSLGEVVAAWGYPNYEESYSGLQLQAVKRVESAFGKSLLALAFGAGAIIATIEHRRKRRICKLLLLHGLIKADVQKT